MATRQPALSTIAWSCTGTQKFVIVKYFLQLFLKYEMKGAFFKLRKNG
jgi:hypothetical protein